MRVLSSNYESRGNVEPMVGLTVQLGTPGAEMRMCMPPDCAAAEEIHATVASGVRPAGVCR
jgi:hypothetical protein